MLRLRLLYPAMQQHCSGGIKGWPHLEELACCLVVHDVRLAGAVH